MENRALTVASCDAPCEALNELNAIPKQIDRQGVR